MILPLGSHTLRVEAEGYLPRETTVSVEADLTPSSTSSMVPLDMTVLLVDDTGTHPYDARPHYEAAHGGASGVPYDLFEVPVDEDGPSAQQMAGYDVVVWFTGGSFIGAGPSERDEEELAAYLDDGGSLLLMQPGLHLYSRGLTPFGRAYLGMAGYQWPTPPARRCGGVPGHPVGGAFPPTPWNWNSRASPTKRTPWWPPTTPRRPSRRPWRRRHRPRPSTA